MKVSENYERCEIGVGGEMFVTKTVGKKELSLKKCAIVKSMVIEIDQSGKVEHTSHVTVVADSLGNPICIKAVEKQKIQAIYRRLAIPREKVHHLITRHTKHLKGKWLKSH